MKQSQKVLLIGALAMILSLIGVVVLWGQWRLLGALFLLFWGNNLRSDLQRAKL